MLYGIVGGGVFLIDFACYYFLAFVASFSQEISTGSAKCVGFFVGFYAHRHITFRDSHQRMGTSRQLSAYILLGLSNALLSSFLMSQVSNLEASIVLSVRLISDVVIVVTSFTISRYLIFR